MTQSLIKEPQAAALTVAQSAAYLAVSEPTLWRMLRDGDLPRVRLRGRTLIRRLDLDALLEECAGAGR